MPAATPIPTFIQELAARLRRAGRRLLRAQSMIDPQSAGGICRLRLARHCAGWRSAGVRFDFLPTAFITTTTTRLLPVGGGLAMVEALTAACKEGVCQLPVRDYGAVACDDGWRRRWALGETSVGRRRAADRGEFDGPCLRRLRGQSRDARALYWSQADQLAAGRARRALQQGRRHPHGARYRRCAQWRFRRLSRRADRSSLRRGRACDLHVSLWHPGQQGGRALHRRSARHRRCASTKM